MTVKSNPALGPAITILAWGIVLGQALERFTSGHSIRLDLVFVGLAAGFLTNSFIRLKDLKK